MTAQESAILQDAQPGVQSEPSLDDYDRFIVFFSGGKDSVACFLWLLDQGISVEKIELHHHLVDGREGSELMDWPITTDYCTKFAASFGVRMSFSWKEGGFEREMLRHEAPTAPVHFYTQSGEKRQIGGVGPLGTREKFPQVSADLSVRWCSSYLKIGVGEAYIVNDPVFRQGKTLVLTGERAEESTARARYKAFEPHRSDNRDGVRVKRWVDVFRAVHSWKEAQVWDIMRKYGVNPHPAYHLGLSRTSCMACIFGSPQQWAMLKTYMPRHFSRIANYETAFGTTIKRGATVEATAAKGIAPELDPYWLDIAMGNDFTAPILIEPSTWVLPLGAFGETSGPT
ncbi:phosphoadenosine phosphosulfate reductase family protein [Paraburkholderia sp. UCT31]|nr:phosphoadenosine phosphosulfate reductase family protein [Paraburkholderia sp. UCT31]